MAEYIGREAAINTVYSMLCRWDTNDVNDLKNLLLVSISELPAADVVEARHGHYICRKDEFGRLKMICSACGEETGMSYRAKKEHMHYCPNCGAKMTEDRHEQKE